MRNSILNLTGVAVLTKNQQKSVNGGNGSNCRLKITEGGTTYLHNQMFVASTDAGISQAANNACVQIIADGASKCSYDCGYDGYGQ